MQLVGIRDLKNRLTHYLESAKRGESIIVTDRGVPVAILHDLEHVDENAGIEERLASFAKLGFLTLPKGIPGSRFPRLDRVMVKGDPISDTILEHRR
jgi:prevent-host-death family protein